MTIIVMMFAILSYSFLYQNISTNVEEKILKNISSIIENYTSYDEAKGLTLFASENNQSLSDFLQQDNQSVRIIDQDKNILSQTGVLKTQLKPSLSKINTVFLTGKTQSSFYDDLNNSQSIHILSPIVVDDEIVGIIEISQPTSDSLEALDQLLLILVIGVFASIAISLVAGYILSRQTFGYVNQLIDNVEAITNTNDLDKRLPVPKDNVDELTRLASTFNTMLAKIQVEFLREKNFTSNASHDLKTPLTIIQGNVDLALKKKVFTPSQTSKTYHTIKKETKRMSSMIEDLLEISTVEKTYNEKLEDINIVGVISQIISSCKDKTREKNITISFKKPAKQDKYVIFGNPNQIKRVFANIIDNAIKYNVQNGNIIIKLHCKLDKIYIDIKDSGIGIDEKDLPYVFDRLYQSKKSRTGLKQGFGIGLAIVKEIVEIHGGSINITSVKKSGSKATIVFPQI